MRSEEVKNTVCKKCVWKKYEDCPYEHELKEERHSVAQQMLTNLLIGGRKTVRQMKQSDLGNLSLKTALYQNTRFETRFVLSKDLEV